eukprot:CAMPEP_0184502700 /NCGR_PEP_ID=MMETSP0113_2-20130426/51030_1 /TAXON_ID=91329 /ORGANISM="Norrisiella sphaerica, Strain BC52" /LENGTH=562 /DNA_ID=CAMNT_0026891995 /DNA_START=364 /DNA_END=2052 /DNA_ORIENTATION=-
MDSASSYLSSWHPIACAWPGLSCPELCTEFCSYSCSCSYSWCGFSKQERGLYESLFRAYTEDGRTEANTGNDAANRQASPLKGTQGSYQAAIICDDPGASAGRGNRGRPAGRDDGGPDSDSDSDSGSSYQSFAPAGDRERTHSHSPAHSHRHSGESNQNSQQVRPARPQINLNSSAGRDGETGQSRQSHLPGERRRDGRQRDSSPHQYQQKIHTVDSGGRFSQALANVKNGSHGKKKESKGGVYVEHHSEVHQIGQVDFHNQREELGKEIFKEHSPKAFVEQGPKACQRKKRDGCEEKEGLDGDALKEGSPIEQIKENSPKAFVEQSPETCHRRNNSGHGEQKEELEENSFIEHSAEEYQGTESGIDSEKKDLEGNEFIEYVPHFSGEEKGHVWQESERIGSQAEAHQDLQLQPGGQGEHHEREKMEEIKEPEYDHSAPQNHAEDQNWTQNKAHELPALHPEHDKASQLLEQGSSQRGGEKSQTAPTVDILCCNGAASTANTAGLLDIPHSKEGAPPSPAESVASHLTDETWAAMTLSQEARDAVQDIAMIDKALKMLGENK